MSGGIAPQVLNNLNNSRELSALHSGRFTPSVPWVKAGWTPEFSFRKERSFLPLLRIEPRSLRRQARGLVTNQQRPHFIHMNKLMAAR